MGVRVVQAGARFAGAQEVTAGDLVVAARRIVIATGSAPTVPPIPGLQDVPFLTNETVFDNDVLPEKRIVGGGGEMGLEMAQAHCLLGARVTVLEAARVLAKDDPELAELLIQHLIADGVAIAAGVKIRRVERAGSRIAVVLEDGAGEGRIEGPHVLVATGPPANLGAPALDKAGTRTAGRGGLIVDTRLRTTNRRVYAVGDAAGAAQLTPHAHHPPGNGISNALF